MNRRKDKRPPAKKMPPSISVCGWAQGVMWPVHSGRAHPAPSLSAHPISVTVTDERRKGTNYATLSQGDGTLQAAEVLSTR